MPRKRPKNLKPKPNTRKPRPKEILDEGKPPQHSRPVQEPRDWERAILAAYFLSLGTTITAAARNAGVSRETLSGWTHSPWWHKAETIAHQRWLDNVQAKTKKSILDSLKSGSDRGHMTRFVAERVMPEFAPPRQRHQINLGELTVAQLQDQLPEALKVLGLAGSTQKLLEAKLNDGDQSVQPGDETQAEVGEALGVHADSDDD